MKRKFYTAIKIDGEFERTDKRGYKDLYYCQLNAEQMSTRGEGLEVAILHNGKLIEYYFKGKKQEGAGEAW